jgi:hypothetical protein
MAVQYTFARVEKKYFLTPAQKQQLLSLLDKYTEDDAFPRSTVYSLYYDTPTFELIRHSAGRPVYKEKLRLRSYDIPAEESPVFLEVKKKCQGVVYKRRIRLPLSEARGYLQQGVPPESGGQIFREIDWFVRHQPQLRPVALVACDRLALVGCENHDLRITFDEHIRWREEALELAEDAPMTPLCPGKVLMEIKIPGAAPLWLCHLLSQMQLYPVTFSKYGTCYRDTLLPENFERMAN